MTDAPHPILDFTRPLDIGILDDTINAAQSTIAGVRDPADKILQEFKLHPDAWTRADQILDKSTNLLSKFFALQILEDQIKYRWNVLPEEQREGIKNYVAQTIIDLSKDEAAFRQQKIFVSKLNIVLVQILKHEWPGRWKSFIPDIVGASKTSESLCENSMNILKLLSEEIFDFSRGEMTQAKTYELKQSLNNEFAQVHDLCLFVLKLSQKQQLLNSTLSTLHAFLTWIPIGYIFESDLLEILLSFLTRLPFRNGALKCLTEIATLEVPQNYQQQVVKTFTIFMQQLQQILPISTDIPSAYENGSDYDEIFFQDLAAYFTGILKAQITLFENSIDEVKLLNVRALDYLIGIAYVEDEDIFKVCIDYFHDFVSKLFQSEGEFEFRNSQFSLIGGQNPMKSSRKLAYSVQLSKLRLVLINKMAKPEEILIVEDENGDIVKQTVKDSNTQALYKMMRETLIYLAHLDHKDTANQMGDKLVFLLSGEAELSWNSLNRLCWAIGSISGSMKEDLESAFLVKVIKNLLDLCETTKGKGNKAVIASNIMYVVGQYPRFLRAHWKFLKTVVNKLFEFMHEPFPGVKDMAVETYLKIAMKCKRMFIIHQDAEKAPFLFELLDDLQNVIRDLNQEQIQVFFEAVGHMINAEHDRDKQASYLGHLMKTCNIQWHDIITRAKASPDVLQQREVIKVVQNILRNNVAVATSLGTRYITQLQLIFEDMLNVYMMYSELVSMLIKQGGPHASKTVEVKLLRSVKKDTMRIVQTFVEKSEDRSLLASQYVPRMLDPILGDYARNVPDARDPECLSLFAAIINKLGQEMMDTIPKIFQAVFDCTLQMITKDFESYPEHRVQFFNLLHAITANCFRSLLSLSPAQLKLVMDSIIWAIRHTERNVAETGLDLMLNLLKNFDKTEFASNFYQLYFKTILSEIFAVLTDTFHKPGFRVHALVLQQLFSVVENGSVITIPLWDVNSLGPTTYQSNAHYVREDTIKLLAESFPNMSHHQVSEVVDRMFTYKKDLKAFKNHLRDFLVQTKDFSKQDNQDLYAEEMEALKTAELSRLNAIPGMQKPSEMSDDMTS